MSGAAAWELQRDHVLKSMTFALRVGEAMLESSVATSDVEEAVRRLTSAYGLGRCEVSVTLNVVTLCYLHPSLDAPVTLVRVVDLGDPQLDRLVALDRLTREVEAGGVGVDDAVQRLEALLRSERGAHVAWTTGAAALVSAAAWVVFAGGGIPGAIAGVVGALLIELVGRGVSRSRVPAVFATILAAAITVAVPSAAAWLGMPIVLSSAIIGGLYPLLPGGALVASVTDGLSGAPLSSMAKGLQALIVATAIAVGVIGALSAIEAMGGVTGVAGAPPADALVLVAGAVAVGALGVARSMPWAQVVPTMVIAVLAQVVADVLADPAPGFSVGVFAAAVVIGVGSQVAARVLMTTAVGFTSTAVFVLVPGVTFYTAMVAFASGDSAAGVDLLTRAVGISAAIAAGIGLGVAVARSVPTPRPPVAVWRRGLRR